MSERVLVTGGAGFIGSHLCDALLARGHAVLAVDDLSLGKLENLAAARASASFSFDRLDVRDAGTLTTIAKEFGPQAVFHLAANSDIGAGVADPAIDLKKTFMSTLGALEACAAVGAKDFLFASSSAGYGEAGAGPIPEDFGPLRPISFYGAAKAAAEAYVSAFGHLRGLRTWAARFPNVVGDRATHGVIYDLVRKLKRDPSTLEVLGDGNQEKPYLLVDDLVDALLFAWRKLPGAHEVFHIGPKGATKVRHIAEWVVARVSPNARIVYTGGDRGWKGDVPRFSYQTKVLEAAGWQPSRDSDAAAREAVDRIARELSA